MRPRSRAEGAPPSRSTRASQASPQSVGGGGRAVGSLFRVVLSECVGYPPWRRMRLIGFSRSPSVAVEGGPGQLSRCAREPTRCARGGTPGEDASLQEASSTASPPRRAPAEGFDLQEPAAASPPRDRRRRSSRPAPRRPSPAQSCGGACQGCSLPLAQRPTPRRVADRSEGTTGGRSHWRASSVGSCG
jgi:hypothetical protein